ncbi:hypothetical protein NUW58_g8532 [Xylaria curta]|uniref:Uncharacterized protein n=1 Tax=Xylaria curta TaxID=42375 RepID=A0ACC1N6C0_9PEZI|nr:hypothetical protein NUW58_g8532 [Xylaria curta]
MATLDTLKWALRRCAISTSKQPLSDSEYSDGFDTLVQGPGFRVYREFIIPQLSQLLTPLLNSRAHISVLEIGPGPKSVFGYLPSHQTRKISRYVAFEPNHLFATRLEECLRSTSRLESPLPCLESPPDIHRTSFEVDGATRSGTGSDNEFDIILFCHSMYGMSPKGKFIERSLEMLSQQPGGAMVVVFHRDGTLHFDGLVCHRTVPFPTGVIVVPNVDEILDRFASFVAGVSRLGPP